MKVRHTYPSGQTTASKIKALLLCLQAKKGMADADVWLEALRLSRSDVEDETRLYPLASLHAAALAFLELVPEGFGDLGRYFVVADNLGVWARVLRGTRTPEETFSRIDSSDSEHGRTTRWETALAAPGVWRGRVRIGHDPALEKDGILGRLREIELAVVPLLFGYAGAIVAKKSATDDAQEYEVRWSVGTSTREVATAAGLGGVVGAGALVVAPSLATAAIALVAPIACGFVGVALGKDRARRVEAAAQAMRVSALERSLALREDEERVAAGDLEGSVVAGQYRIRTRMGSGASGVIYEATRIADGLPVAIKLLRAAAAHDVVASDRLRREAEALGLSWHPNVVEVLDHGHLADGTSYLVMELLRGETLALRLRYKTRLAPDQVMPIAIQMTDAVVAMHAAGVVHRDLKPSNVYLVRDEETGEEKVKVFDFGIARVEWEEMRITNIGAPMGTPGYMSPEQESGGDVDARSDVFALGAMIYECLIGEPPPPMPSDMWLPGRGSSSSALRAAELRVDDLDAARSDSGVQPASRRLPSAAPLSLAVPVDVPRPWRDLVERATKRNADERFQDARALLAALRTIRSDSLPAEPRAASSSEE